MPTDQPDRERAKLNAIKERHESLEDYARGGGFDSQLQQEAHEDRAYLLRALDEAREQAASAMRLASREARRTLEVARERDEARAELAEARRECAHSASRIRRMLSDELPDEDTYSDLPLIHDALQKVARAATEPEPMVCDDHDLTVVSHGATVNGEMREGLLVLQCRDCGVHLTADDCGSEDA